MEVALVIRCPGESFEVLVEADGETPVADLIDALRSYTGTAGDLTLWLERAGGALDPASRVGTLELRHGDSLDFAPPGRQPTWSTRPRGAQAPFELLVVGGPASGRRFPLIPGDHVVGRDPAKGISVPDDAVSRRHLVFSVRSDGVSVEDLGSTNGTFVDGRRVTGPVALEPGRVVEAGSTMLSVERGRATVGSADRYGDGRLLFNRRPRVTKPFEPRSFAVPSAPGRPRKNRLPLAAALVPVLLGFVMFLVLQNAIFLIFTAMGPIMAIWSFVDDRRSGRKEFRDTAKEYGDALDRLDSDIAVAHDAEMVARRAAAPSPAHVLERVVGRDPMLWERRPEDVDFLEVRLGLADLPSRLTVEIPGGGDAELRARAERVRAQNAVDHDVPVTLDLADLGVVGLAAGERASDDLLQWVALQIAASHSPRDVAIVALVPEHRVDRWAWLRWLPHTETLLPGARTVAATPDDVRRLFDVVERLASGRRAERAQQMSAGLAQFLPHVVLLVPGDVPVQSAALAGVLAGARDVSISAVVVAPAVELLPGEARVVVTAGSPPDEIEVTWTERGDRVSGVVIDAIASADVVSAAVVLAPLRDVSARDAAGGLPPRVDLLELEGIAEPSPDDVLARWAVADGLIATIGLGAAGPFELDLRAQGPHGLVAGTTGSGKSELLQTLVVAFALRLPPERLNFVLIDYKGGAAFKDCVALPHTVGFVTDLDGHLARRALVSLEAELRRRERLLGESGVKDLIELEQRDPAHAPANLLIVVDEFAFLKREVPDFVKGIVDIAQRGRSLGVHLLLATQRPTGVIDDHIRANTNLRIALRMSDETESRDVIDRPDAAHIAASLAGRAFVRTGHAQVQPVQAAYVGGRVTATETGEELRVRPFRLGLGSAARPGAPGSASTSTDLQRLVRAIRVAAERVGAQNPHRPWLEPLRDAYPLGELPSPSASGRSELTATMGVLDDPARQDQRVAGIDLGRVGHLVVYGMPGSGKTTALRTMVASLASRLSARDLHVYALDFGNRGLRPLEALPHCGGVVNGEEGERVARLFAMLDAFVEDRRQLLGAAGSGSLEEYRARPDAEVLPYVLVLLDGYGAFRATFDQLDQGELVDRFAQLVSDGRGVGIHFVITADRRGAVSQSLSGLISERLVLRLADPDEYSWLGLAKEAKDAVLSPGRGFLNDGTEMQVAVVGDSGSGDAQTQALRDLGSRLREGGEPVSVPGVQLLPEVIDGASLPKPEVGRLRLPIGIDALTFGPAWIDLDDVPHLLVVGPDGTGRSTTLRTITVAFQNAMPDSPVYILTPRRSVLRDGATATETAVGIDACEQLAHRLAADVRDRSESDVPVLVVVDDGDELAEGRVATSLEQVVRRGRDTGVHVIAGAQTHVVHRSYAGWLAELKKLKHGLILQPDVDIDGDVFGVRLPRRSVRSFPAGRGYAIRRGALALVQVAQHSATT